MPAGRQNELAELDPGGSDLARDGEGPVPNLAAQRGDPPREGARLKTILATPGSDEGIPHL